MLPPANIGGNQYLRINNKGSSGISVGKALSFLANTEKGLTFKSMYQSTLNTNILNDYK